MADRRIIMGYLENEAYLQGQIDELYKLLDHGEADPLARLILARIRELEAQRDG